MRKLLITVITALTLAGCSSSPSSEQINFIPAADKHATTLSNTKEVAITTKDMRTAQYLALVNKHEDKALPIHAKQNVRVAFNNALQDIAKRQGIEIKDNSSNQLQLEIQEALVNITSSTFSSQMKAKVKLTVTAQTPKGHFTKTYTGTANAKNAMGASNEQVEEIINHVSKLVLNDIADDIELNHYIEKNFK